MTKHTSNTYAYIIIQRATYLKEDEFLATERDIAAVGLDTPSIDYGQSTDFQSHVTLYQENIFGMENLANLDELPEAGATVIALPMKIEGGSGGPVRVVAYLPE